MLNATWQQPMLMRFLRGSGYRTVALTARQDAVRGAANATADPFAAIGALRDYPLVCVSCEVSKSQDLLFPEEADLVRSAVPRRREQFRAGRWAARCALSELDVPPTPVLRGAMGRPLWPPGIVGSITHTDTHAAAVVARSDSILGIGIDLAEAAELPEELLPHVLTCAELAALGASRDSRGLLGKATFAAKEAIYKCVYPLGGEVVGFQDVQARFTCGGTRFEASPARTFRGSDLLESMRGFFARDARFVAAICLLPSVPAHGGDRFLFPRR